jgi:hypothetical protein
MRASGCDAEGDIGSAHRTDATEETPAPHEPDRRVPKQGQHDLPRLTTRRRQHRIVPGRADRRPAQIAGPPGPDTASPRRPRPTTNGGTDRRRALAPEQAAGAAVAPSRTDAVHGEQRAPWAGPTRQNARHTPRGLPTARRAARNENTATSPATGSSQPSASRLAPRKSLISQRFAGRSSPDLPQARSAGRRGANQRHGEADRDCHTAPRGKPDEVADCDEPGSNATNLLPAAEPYPCTPTCGYRAAARGSQDAVPRCRCARRSTAVTTRSDTNQAGVAARNAAAHGA